MKQSLTDCSSCPFSSFPGSSSYFSSSPPSPLREGLLEELPPGPDLVLELHRVPLLEVVPHLLLAGLLQDGLLQGGLLQYGLLQDRLLQDGLLYAGLL